MVCLNSTFAQEQAKFDVNSSFKFINLSEKGALLLDKEETDFIRIKKIDTTLALNWEVNVKVEKKDIFFDHYIIGEFIYLLFRNFESDEVIVNKVALEIGAMHHYEIKNISDFLITKFSANEECLIIGGRVKNEDVVLFYNLENKTSKLINNNLAGETLLQFMEIDSLGNSSIGYINTFDQKSQIILENYDPLGFLISSFEAKCKDGNEFVTANLFKIDNHFIVIGNYGEALYFDNNNENIIGIFMLDLEKENNPRYYEYTQFQSFYQFMTDKEITKMVKKSDRRNMIGKENHNDFRIHINHITNYKNNLILTADLYYPKIKNRELNPIVKDVITLSSLLSFRPTNLLDIYQITYDNYFGISNATNLYYIFSNKNPKDNNSYYIEGFRYMSGIVFSIDSSGTLLWDNSFPYNKVTFNKIKNATNITGTSKTLDFTYNDNQNIMVKQLDFNGKINENYEIKESNYKSYYNTRKFEYGYLDYWFGKYYINWRILEKYLNPITKKQTCMIQKLPIKL